MNDDTEDDVKKEDDLHDIDVCELLPIEDDVLENCVGSCKSDMSRLCCLTSYTEFCRKEDKDLIKSDFIPNRVCDILAFISDPKLDSKESSSFDESGNSYVTDLGDVQRLATEIFDNPVSPSDIIYRSDSFINITEAEPSILLKNNFSCLEISESDTSHISNAHESATIKLSALTFDDKLWDSGSVANGSCLVCPPKECVENDYDLRHCSFRQSAFECDAQYEMSESFQGKTSSVQRIDDFVLCTDFSRIQKPLIKTVSSETCLVPGCSFQSDGKFALSTDDLQTSTALSDNSILFLTRSSADSSPLFSVPDSFRSTNDFPSTISNSFVFAAGSEKVSEITRTEDVLSQRLPDESVSSGSLSSVRHIKSHINLQNSDPPFRDKKFISPQSEELCNVSLKNISVHQFSNIHFIPISSDLPSDATNVKESYSSGGYRNSIGGETEIKRGKRWQYLCSQNECNRRFKYRSHFSYHLLVHEKAKCFVCSECGRGFRKKQQLQVHSETHSSRKPFPCTLCHKDFLTAQNLQNHQRTHTGLKPFVCIYDKCSKRFAERSTLNKHLVTHTNNRKYQCSQCDKVFTQSSSRNYHIKRLHSSKE